MTPIRWSPQAVRDVEAIREYIAQDSQRYAQLTVDRIIASVERLGAFPQSGRVVPERSDPEIREVIVGPFRVVYRYRSGVIDIATVFRGSRLFPSIE
ncbi:MAG: type II toxin-antitoxin system RelE/ParE family toxin [Vicinamibacteria bacterium]